MPDSTREEQYNVCLDADAEFGREKLGLMSGFTWLSDPKRLTFVLARYKFVAKMFSGYGKVLEIGCADAFASRIVKQEVDELVVTDFDPVFINDVDQRMHPRHLMDPQVHDILSGPMSESFDGVFALDVLEHIEPADEDRFLANVCGSLAPHGAAIIGMPSIESQAYASEASKAGHVNCKKQEDLKAVMERHFHNVFMFSMNDEMVHTGYARMAHYIIALACGVRG